MMVGISIGSFARTAENDRPHEKVEPDAKPSFDRVKKNVPPGGSPTTRGHVSEDRGHAPDAAQKFAQELPNAGLSRPITLTVLPQTLTGTCTGTWMRLPDSTPGEPAATPWAAAPPWAEAAPAA